MSRSLVFAFMIALILHVFLAGVQFDLFKGPLRVRNAPEAITVDLIKPIEEKKPSKAEKPPVIVKKPEKDRIKTSVAKKTKPGPKPRTKPTIKKDNTRIQREMPSATKEASQKIEAPVYLPSPEISREKEEKPNSERKHAFIPDMVDIPTALPNRDDVSHAEEEDRSPLSSLDEPVTFATPNYKKNSPPTYPLLARRRNYEGTVLLDVLVRREGTVDSIKLARSSGHEALDRAAIRAVSEWSFHPGKRGDEAVEMWVTIPIRFQLQ